MAPIGSVIKNTLVYFIIMAAATFAAVNFFLFNAFENVIRYVQTDDFDYGQDGITQLFFGILILVLSFGLALNLTLPSIVGDELVEF